MAKDLIEKFAHQETIQNLLDRMQQSTNKIPMLWEKINHELGCIYVNMEKLKTASLDPTQQTYIIFTLQQLLINQAKEFPADNIIDELIVMEYGFETCAKFSTQKQSTALQIELIAILLHRHDKKQISLKQIAPRFLEFLKKPIQEQNVSPTFKHPNLPPTIQTKIIDLTTPPSSSPSSPIASLEISGYDQADILTQLNENSNPGIQQSNDNPSNISTLLPQKEEWHEQIIIKSVQQTLQKTFRKPNEKFKDFQKRLITDMSNGLQEDLKDVSTQFLHIINLNRLKETTRNTILALVFNHLKENKGHGRWPSKKIKTPDKKTWEEKVKTLDSNAKIIYQSIEDQISTFINEKNIARSLESKTPIAEKPYARRYDSIKYLPHTFIGEQFSTKIEEQILYGFKHPDIHFVNTLAEETLPKVTNKRKRLIEDPFFSSPSSPPFDFAQIRPADAQSMPTFTGGVHIDILNPINRTTICKLRAIILNEFKKLPIFEEKVILRISRKIDQKLPILPEQLKQFFIETIKEAATEGLKFKHKVIWVIKDPSHINIQCNESIIIELGKNHALMLQEALGYLQNLAEEAELSDASTISMSSTA